MRQEAKSAHAPQSEPLARACGVFLPLVVHHPSQSKTPKLFSLRFRPSSD
jgi:hypothetical protein